MKKKAVHESPAKPTGVEEAQAEDKVRAKLTEVLAGASKHFTGPWVVDKETGGLQLQSQEIAKQQESLVTALMSFSDEDRMPTFPELSIPTIFLETKTALDYLANLWCFAPLYLCDLYGITDPVFILKRVITFAIAGLYKGLPQKLPFMPLLGETYNCQLRDEKGTIDVCMEQTSVNPPVTHFYLVASNFRMYGYYEYQILISADCSHVCLKGPTTIEFESDLRVQYYYPLLKLQGQGNRIREIFLTGFMRFQDSRSNKGIVRFNYGKQQGAYGRRQKDTRLDTISGIVYKSGDRQRIEVPQFPEVVDAVMIHSFLSGSWLESLAFESPARVVSFAWELGKQPPAKIIFPARALDSDSRFRRDILALEGRYFERANKLKADLDAAQKEQLKMLREVVLLPRGHIRFTNSLY